MLHLASRHDRRSPVMRYGLRCILNGHEARLLQITGGGRIRIEVSGIARWSKPPAVAWEVYEADRGETYPTREAAEEVAKNLAAAALTS